MFSYELEIESFQLTNKVNDHKLLRNYLLKKSSSEYENEEKLFISQKEGGGDNREKVASKMIEICCE